MTADEAYDRLHGLDGCAQSPARVLRDAALFFEREMSRAWGGDAQWLTTGRRVAGVVADVLREEAADLDAERVAGVLRETAAGNNDPGHEAVTPRYTSDADRLTAIQARRSEGFMIGEDYDWLLAAVGRVAGLIAAYGDAEGTPVDYEFLVHHISEAIK